jgi:TetR/AcrR family transcriptional regulator, cholesterol catabolism regulator
MNTHTPRARMLRNSRALRRADEIIDAAARVFAERGYHGTSTQAIADVLGMRQASLYYYFPSKEAALELVCDRGVEGHAEGAEAIVASADAPLAKLTRLIAAHLAPNETKRDYVKVFINERRYLPAASRRRIGRKSRRIERNFEQVIRAGMADGSMRRDIDPRLAMLAVLGMCNAVINWRAADQAIDVHRIAADFAKLVADGMAVRRRPAAARTQVRASAAP